MTTLDLEELEEVDTADMEAMMGLNNGLTLRAL